METTAMTVSHGPLTLAALLKQPAYSKRFEEVLRDRAPQFVSSILNLGATMRDVEPKSIIGCAMNAAALDFPVDKNLGFAWIVPFKHKGVKIAQFQIGYKGFVQLALRTSQYARINAKPINAEAFVGYDEVGEPKIDWDKLDETKPAAGYAVAWKLTNGFVKTCYWSKEKVKAHAEKYSQSYRSGFDSPWKSHFDQMALKTVVKNELSDWGILSIHTVRALQTDQAVITDVDASPIHIDNLPEEQPAMIANPIEEGATEFAPVPKEEQKPAPQSPQEELADLVTGNGNTFDQFMQLAARETLLTQEEIDSTPSFGDIKLSTAKRLLRLKTGILQGLEAMKGGVQ